jgi:transcriptional regulator with XRE-family HTH domain
MPKGQYVLGNTAEIVARLREERRRLGLNQTVFGRLGGVSLDTQNRYESGKTTPDSEYLARLIPEGVDVLYILTGERQSAEGLGPGASRIVSAYLRLPPEHQEVLQIFAEAMLSKYVEIVGPADQD